jgi:predicted DsbA family dithiol-disulfide isomerase
MNVQFDVSYDLVCPFCFVGVSRLHRIVTAAPAGRANVRLWPYQLIADLPEGGVDQRKHFAQRFGEDRLPGIYARMESMAAAEGLRIDYEKMKILPNTLRAHQTVEAVAAGPGRLKLAVALMTAHFSEGRNIGERDVLREVAHPYLDSQSLDAYWNSEAASQRMDESRARAAQLGIRSVPNFVIDGRAVPSTPTAEQLTALLSIGPR